LRKEEFMANSESKREEEKLRVGQSRERFGREGIPAQE
jgi:hypothetical protein